VFVTGDFNANLKHASGRFSYDRRGKSIMSFIASNQLFLLHPECDNDISYATTIGEHRARSAIARSLSDTIYQSIPEGESAVQLWNYIIQRYGVGKDQLAAKVKCVQAACEYAKIITVCCDISTNSRTLVSKSSFVGVLISILFSYKMLLMCP
jgi:hypothetical protein